MLRDMECSLPRTVDRTKAAPIEVLIVDDEAFVRNALRMYLATEDDIKVVGEAADGDSAVAQTVALNPDIVLMDLQMPDVDGVEATRRIVAECPSTKTLVITAHVTDTFVTDSLLAGASGYVVKDAEPAQIISAIKDVQAGDRPVDPTVTHHLIAQLERAGASVVDTDPSGFLHITGREKEVLEALCQGQGNREIAAGMFISQTTVKYHLVGLMRKFNARSRVELVAFALRRGVVS